MPAPVFDGDTLRMVDGAPVVRTFFLNRKDWEILDTWDMASLHGSGSHDVKAEGASVPPRFASVELMGLPARYPNPVFRIPVPLRGLPTTRPPSAPASRVVRSMRLPISR